MCRLLTAMLAVACLGWGAAQAQVTTKTFALATEAKFLSCLRFSPAVTPTATVQVQRAGERDRVILTADGLRANSHYDVFTVQRSNLLANGTVDPGFTNFGLAWYQSDLDVNASGHGTVTLFTIFIDQIFGFDPDVALPPVNTFHIGFWFNSPNPAKPCGFTGTTPFNGEHKAGPAAMISKPDPTTGLGPLCLNPNAALPSGCED